MTPRNVGSSLLALIVLLILAAISRASPHTTYYGTTIGGGAYGKGTLFSAWGRNVATQYDFCAKPNCEDGANPEGGVLALGDGTLVGTTAEGGSYGAGVLYSFGPVESGWPGYHVILPLCTKWMACAFWGRPRDCALMGPREIECTSSRKDGRAVLWTMIFDRNGGHGRSLHWWGK